MLKNKAGGIPALFFDVNIIIHSHVLNTINAITMLSTIKTATVKTNNADKDLAVSPSIVEHLSTNLANVKYISIGINDSIMPIIRNAAISLAMIFTPLMFYRYRVNLRGC
jgi:hypothetical protein